MSASPTGGLRRLLLGFIIFGLIVGLVFLVTKTYDVRDNPPRLGSALYASTRPSAAPILYFITEEERVARGGVAGARSLSEAPRRAYTRFRTRRYTTYQLHAIDAITGQPASESINLAKIMDALTGRGPQIIGIAADTLWVWNDRLEGYSLSPLKLKFSNEQLRTLNPSAANAFSNDPKNYKVLAPFDALVFKGSDARYYQADNITGLIVAADEDALAALTWKKKVQDGFDYTYDEGHSIQVLSINSYLWNGFTLPDAHYALLSPDALKSRSQYDYKGSYATSGVATTFSRTPFTTNERQERVLDLAKTATMGDQRFIQGGFICRPNGNPVYNAPRRVFQTDTHALVFHQQALTADPALQLTSLALADGSAAWTKPLGLTEVTDIAECGPTVVFAGYPDAKEPTRRRANILVFVHCASGEVKTVNLTNVP